MSVIEFLVTHPACYTPLPEHIVSKLSCTLYCFSAGVEVNLQLQPSSRPVARIESAEQLSMQQLLEEYAANTGMQPEVLDLARSALQVGLERIEQFGGWDEACSTYCSRKTDSKAVSGLGQGVLYMCSL
jgi:hypothetical protein